MYKEAEKEETKALKKVMASLFNDKLYRSFTDEDAKRKYFETTCILISPELPLLTEKKYEAMGLYSSTKSALKFVVIAMVVVHIILGYLWYIYNY